MEILFLCIDRFIFECLKWASCNGDKCNKGIAMAKGAMKELQ
jgi:hypothetical protein